MTNLYLNVIFQEERSLSMYHNISCGNCGRKLRINPGPKNIGHTLKVKCPHCHFVTKVIVEEEVKSTPDDLDKVPLIIADDFEELNRVIGENQEIRAILERVYNKGFVPVIALGAFYDPIKLRREESGDPRDRYEFSERDRQMLKNLKIRL